jgi:hypothetical protein
MAAGESYLNWRAAVDRRLHEIYLITIEDAGFDEKYLVGHYRTNQTPTHFVQWFGNKYDLDRRPTPLRATNR